MHSFLLLLLLLFLCLDNVREEVLELLRALEVLANRLEEVVEGLRDGRF